MVNLRGIMYRRTECITFIGQLYLSYFLNSDTEESTIQPTVMCRIERTLLLYREVIMNSQLFCSRSCLRWKDTITLSCWKMAPFSEFCQRGVLSEMYEKRDVFIAFRWKEVCNNGKCLETMKPVHLKHLASEQAIYTLPEGKGIHPCTPQECSIICICIYGFYC